MVSGLLEAAVSTGDMFPSCREARGLESRFVGEPDACSDRDLKVPLSACPTLEVGADLLPFIPYSTAT